MKKVLSIVAVAISFTACTSVETRDVKQDSVKCVDTTKAVDTTKSCVEDVDTTTSKKK